MEYDDPISNIKWVDVRKLDANSYNPNVVYNDELNLLVTSILKSGWIQPILIANDNVIIDGYHRHWISKNNKKIIEKYNYKVPVATLGINKVEAMYITVRMNRAKGSHMAIKMSELIKNLIDDHGEKIPSIANNLGMDIQEVELLYADSIWKKLELDKHNYSQAWYPKNKGKKS